MIKEIKENNLEPQYQDTVIIKNSIFNKYVVKHETLMDKTFECYYSRIVYKYDTKLINLLITNDDYYQNLIAVLENDSTDKVKLGGLRHYFIVDTKREIPYFDYLTTYPKSVFAKIVESLINKGEIKKSERTDKIMQLTSTDRLLEKVKDTDMFSIKIEDKVVSIPKIELLNYFMQNNSLSLYYSIKNLEDMAQKYNLDKASMAYVIYEFANKEQIFSKYTFNFFNENLYKSIADKKIVDFSYINRLNKTDDEFLDKTVLNDELVDFVFKDMPKEYSKLEQAIYIYLKLCKTLTYDKDFYAFDQEGQVAQLHQDINRLATITPTNNTVVCYEFNQIYGKLLNMIGINYEIITRASNYSYGKGHVSMVFKADRTLVSADSVTSIIGGDLFNVKIGEEVKGLVTISKDHDLVDAFYATFARIYEEMKSKDKNEETVFQDILKSYSSVSKKSFLSLEEKLDIIERKLKNSNLVGIDKISVLIKTINSVCVEERLMKEINLSIVNKRLPDNTVTPVVVLGNMIGIDTYEYYEYNDDSKSFNKISQEKLQKDFDDGKYFMSVAQNKNHPLIGITTSSQKSNNFVGGK